MNKFVKAVADVLEVESLDLDTVFREIPRASAISCTVTFALIIS